MRTSQNWIGWAARSYEQIKRSVLGRLPTVNPELTDHSESNPLIILIDIFAGMSEVLHLYIDTLGREVYLSSALKFKSIIKIVRLLDYRVKSCIPAYTDLTFILVDNTQTPTPFLGGTITIPINTVVESVPGGVPFKTQSPTSILPGYTRTVVPALQYEEVLQEDFGLTSGLALMGIELPNNYVHKSLQIEIDGIAYNEYDSFGFMGMTTRGFVVDQDEDGIAWAVFGDGINGLIPPANQQILADFRVCRGPSGNLPPNTITNLVDSIAVPTGYTLLVTNPDFSHSGNNFESLEDIRFLAPRHLSTLWRAVTYSDYINLALLAPGVGQADVKYCCADDIKLYIAPKTRGVASKKLLQDVANYFADKKIVGRKLTVLPVGIVRIYIRAHVKGAPGNPEALIKKNIILKLNDVYGYGLQKINSTIFLSDIVRYIDELDSVDAVIVNQIYVEPYATPITHTVPLAIQWGPINTINPQEYRLRYKANPGGTPTIDIFKNNTFYSSTPLNVAWADGNTISFTVLQNGLYTDNEEWSFRVYATYPEKSPDYSIVLQDNVIPIVDVDLNNIDINGVPPFFGSLTVETSMTNTNICKPAC